MNSRQQEYYDEITAIVESKGGKVISECYTKMIDKMLFDCGNGHQWDTEARSILKGMWCRYCHGNTRGQGEQKFRDLVASKGGKVLGDYITSNTRITLECGKGHRWNALPYNVTSGKWCPRCGYVNHGGGSKGFFETIELRKGRVLDEYITSHTKLRVQCNKGHIWLVKPNSIVVGTWCPRCAGSAGEQAIALYLEDRNIPYLTQTTIPGLARKRYDFILPESKTVIEYDGEMHFKYIPYYHVTEEFYRYRQLCDCVKTMHAIESGYKVIRIDPTKVDRINQCLDKAFASKKRLYLSSLDKYTYLLETQISNEDYRTVEEGIPRPPEF